MHAKVIGIEADWGAVGIFERLVRNDRVTKQFGGDDFSVGAAGPRFIRTRACFGSVYTVAAFFEPAARVLRRNAGECQSRNVSEMFHFTGFDATHRLLDLRPAGLDG